MKREGKGILFITDLPGTQYCFAIKGYVKLLESDSSVKIVVHVLGFERPVVVTVTWPSDKEND